MTESVRLLRGERWGPSLQRQLLQSPLPVAQWMQRHTRLIKSDSHSSVGMLLLDRDPCYLKLYAPKSLLQRWLFRRGCGRAVRGFDMAQQLRASGVAVPEPRACLLVDGGLLLLMQGLAGGGDLQSLWRARPEQVQEARVEAQNWLRGAGAALGQLHTAGFAHGDCKWSNLYWNGRQMVLIDLDGAGRAASGSSRQLRDLARFTLNAEELAVASDLYEQFLHSYLQITGGDRDQTVAALSPWLRKLRARHVARYGKRGGRLL